MPRAFISSCNLLRIVCYPSEAAVDIRVHTMPERLEDWGNARLAVQGPCTPRQREGAPTAARRTPLLRGAPTAHHEDAGERGGDAIRSNSM